METISKIRKWGNSFGVLVPKELIRKENFKVNEEVVVKVEKKTDISKVFGILRTERTTKDLMREIREGYGE